tara:strand:+ start:141 stop:623 length:483 start_codon:yes stop_codon:yes gene_type:complete
LFALQPCNSNRHYKLKDFFIGWFIKETVKQKDRFLLLLNINYKQNTMSFLSTLFGKKEETTGNITILNKTEYATQIITNDIKPFDVRTASEFNSGHIKKAINVDVFNAGNFNKYFEKLDKDKPVYVYCRSGSRSQKAARKLLKLGFSQVYDLKGGYSAWN